MEMEAFEKTALEMAGFEQTQETKISNSDSHRPVPKLA